MFKERNRKESFERHVLVHNVSARRLRLIFHLQLLFILSNC